MSPHSSYSPFRCCVAWFALIVGGSTLCSTFAADGKGEQRPNYRTPPRQYENVLTESRTIVVEQELLTHDPTTAKLAIKRLDENIDRALRILPKHAHPFVKKQQFWLMYGPEASSGGRRSGLSYFRPGSPQHDDKRDARWNSVVVVYSAKNYLHLTDLWALKAVLHELAHAYQLEQWPEKEPRILAAFDHSAASRLYRNVESVKAETIEAAYATKNQLEYFAELSCMFFVECNYFPFDRMDLREYDPVGYRMIRNVWKIGDEFGKHESRTWRIGRDGRPLPATFVSHSAGRITLIDSANRKRTIRMSAVSELDREYVARWLELPRNEETTQTNSRPAQKSHP